MYIFVSLFKLKNTQETVDIGTNIFAHWVTEIDIKWNGDDLQTLPTNNATDIYQYSDAILKRMPKDAH